MADSPLLPGSHSGPVDPKTGLWRREWYGFLRDLVRFVQQTSGNTDSLASVLARLQALEDEPPVAVGSVIGDMSVDVEGILADGGLVLLRLLNDATAPGTTYYYGTNADGTKGWHLLGDALLEGPGITLTVDGTTGEITVALADVTPGVGGSFLLTTFDAQGRRSEEQAGTAADVPVDDTGWSEISGAEVQAALDSTDTALAARQPLDPTLTALAGLDASAGLVEQTGPDNFTKRAIGVASATDVLTRADGDGRYDAAGAAAAALVAANDYTDDEIATREPTITAGTTAQFWRGDKAFTNTLLGEVVVSVPGTVVDALTFENFATPARVASVRYNGSVGSPTTVANGNAVARYQGNAYDGTSSVEIVRVQMSVDGAVSTGIVPSRLEFYTTNTSGALLRRWLIDAAGDYLPVLNSTYNIGSSAAQVNALHTSEIHLYEAEYQTGVQSVSLTANTDNLSLNSSTRILRLSSNGAYNLTGITGGASGRRLTLLNTSAFTITQTHDATSTAANRFFCPNNTNVAVRQNGATEMIYDATSSRWRVIGA